MRECMQKISWAVFGFWNLLFPNSFHLSAQITFKYQSRVHVRTTTTKTFTWTVNLNFLGSYGVQNIDTAFKEFLLIFKEGEHGFHYIKFERGKTWFQTVLFWRVRKIFAKKHEFFVYNNLVECYNDGKCFSKIATFHCPCRLSRSGKLFVREFFYCPQIAAQMH